ncbi:MAG: hypothetical protein J7J75_04990, partial [Euryarchaeota archaeon]|nr:hypothetical protein [Euryarchaeota archaeon]
MPPIEAVEMRLFFFLHLPMLKRSMIHGSYVYSHLETLAASGFQENLKNFEQHLRFIVQDMSGDAGMFEKWLIRIEKEKKKRHLEAQYRKDMLPAFYEVLARYGVRRA